jgi:hypothetical protein
MTAQAPSDHARTALALIEAWYRHDRKATAVLMADCDLPGVCRALVSFAAELLAGYRHGDEDLEQFLGGLRQRIEDHLATQEQTR